MFKIKHVVALAALLYYLSGCAVPQPKLIIEPELQKISYAEVGERIYQKTFAIFEEHKNVKFEHSHNRIHGSYYLIKTKDGCQARNRRLMGFFIDKECDGAFEKYSYRKYNEIINPPLKYTLAAPLIKELKFNSFQREVIYQGIRSNILTLSFREYFGANTSNTFLIKDAFTQKISYTLDDSHHGIVGFKGLRIIVLEANNTKIKYIILKDYNY